MSSHEKQGYSPWDVVPLGRKAPEALWPFSSKNPHRINAPEVRTYLRMLPIIRRIAKIASPAFTLLQASLMILLVSSLCLGQQIDSPELQITSPPPMGLLSTRGKRSPSW